MPPIFLTISHSTQGTERSYGGTPKRVCDVLTARTESAADIWCLKWASISPFLRGSLPILFENILVAELREVIYKLLMYP
jgi:hypothetical protein